MPKEGSVSFLNTAYSENDTRNLDATVRCEPKNTIELKMKNSLLFVLCIALASVEITSVNRAVAGENLTLILRDRNDCTTSSYLGDRFRRLFETSEELSVEEFVRLGHGNITVPIGGKQDIANAAENLAESAVLVLEGTRCGHSGGLSRDAAFWERQKSRKLRYVAKADFDGDGFVWNLVDFHRKVKKGDRIIAYVSADAYLAQDGYVLLFSDFGDYVGGSDFEGSVRYHGYPMRNLVDGLRALQPSKLDVIIDGTLGTK